MGRFLAKLLPLQKPPIRRRPLADAEEAARAIELLIEQEGDRRVATWLRVGLRTKPVTTMAAEYGCRDGSGADRVIKRLEEEANSDRALSRRPKDLPRKCQVSTPAPSP